MEAIITVTTALRSARLRAEMIPVILEQLTNLLRTQGSALAVFDTTHNQVSMEAGRGIWQSVSGARTSFGSGTISQVIRSSQPYTNNQAILDPVLAGQNLPPDVVAVACVPLITQELPIGAVCVCRRAAFRDQDLHILTAIADMAANAIHRAMLFEQTQKRLQRLSALRAIDLAISASLDLGMTLNILVEQIIIQLGVNAAILLLYDPYTQMLGYAAGQGFRSQAVKQFRVRLGESHAGKVALERRMEIIRNLNEYNDSMTEGLRSLGESFQLYIAVPLVAKGQIMGVLELFQRTTMEIDPEWLEYLQGMAAQAAIAIDNAELFEKLQRSNAELSMAYDATIEGWSRAMELRDQDVEGHSHRVAELTLDFCRAMGITDLSLEHVRWGVLLHDIGVMAIPDRILKKETPLSEEEWQTMRQHPINAYELLSPIPYLRQAIDIPYCHHERWDGAGYPNRLKGEQIPLAARIFAVVDVWDALSSERPYRQAWPRDAVRDYLQQEAGKQFDPKIVESFLVFESSGFLTQRA